MQATIFTGAQQQRSGPEELVPSRYALQVGDIEVLVFSDGILTPPAESMATNADPTIRAAWLDTMFLSCDAFDWALNEVVLRTGDQIIPIDSGLGAEYPDFPRAGQLVHRLQAAGIQASLEGRLKRLHSIHQKLHRQHIEIDQVYDFVALRVLVDFLKPYPAVFLGLGVLQWAALVTIAYYAFDIRRWLGASGRSPARGLEALQ